MKTKVISVYSYNELSDKAKENASQWYLEGDDLNFQWENLQEDSKRIGLELKGETNRGYWSGSFITSALECAEDIMKEHGKDSETYKDAKEFYDKAFPLSEIEERSDEQENELSELEEDFLKILLEDYRILWKKEVKYCQSEEYIKETMELNDYEFDVNGKII